MNGLPVFNYHGIASKEYDYAWSEQEKAYAIQKTVFEKQIAYLHALHFTSISLNDLKTWLAGEANGNQPLMITFDDGHISQFESAAAMLKNRKAHSIFFIPVGLVGQKDQMNWQHLRQLAEYGFEIGSHGYHHVPLTNLSGPRLEHEIADSKKELEDRLGSAVRSFSVPRGYYHPRIREKLNAAGYEFVFTSDFDWNHSAADRLSLKRFAVTRQTSLEDLSQMAFGRLGRRRYVERMKTAARNWLAPSFYDALASLKTKVAEL